MPLEKNSFAHLPRDVHNLVNEYLDAESLENIIKTENPILSYYATERLFLLKDEEGIKTQQKYVKRGLFALSRVPLSPNNLLKSIDYLSFEDKLLRAEFLTKQALRFKGRYSQFVQSVPDSEIKKYKEMIIAKGKLDLGNIKKLNSIASILSAQQLVEITGTINSLFTLPSFSCSNIETLSPVYHSKLSPLIRAKVYDSLANCSKEELIERLPRLVLFLSPDKLSILMTTLLDQCEHDPYSISNLSLNFSEFMSYSQLETCINILMADLDFAVYTSYMSAIQQAISRLSQERRQIIIDETVAKLVSATDDKSLRVLLGLKKYIANFEWVLTIFSINFMCGNLKACKDISLFFKSVSPNQINSFVKQILDESLDVDEAKKIMNWNFISYLVPFITETALREKAVNLGFKVLEFSPSSYNTFRNIGRNITAPEQIKELIDLHLKQLSSDKEENVAIACDALKCVAKQMSEKQLNEFKDVFFREIASNSRKIITLNSLLPVLSITFTDQEKKQLENFIREQISYPPSSNYDTNLKLLNENGSINILPFLDLSFIEEFIENQNREIKAGSWKYAYVQGSYKNLARILYGKQKVIQQEAQIIQLLEKKEKLSLFDDLYLKIALENVQEISTDSLEKIAVHFLKGKYFLMDILASNAHYLSPQRANEIITFYPIFLSPFNERNFTNEQYQKLFSVLFTRLSVSDFDEKIDSIITTINLENTNLNSKKYRLIAFKFLTSHLMQIFNQDLDLIAQEKMRKILIGLINIEAKTTEFIHLQALASLCLSFLLKRKVLDLDLIIALGPKNLNHSYLSNENGYFFIRCPSKNAGDEFCKLAEELGIKLLENPRLNNGVWELNFSRESSKYLGASFNLIRTALYASINSNLHPSTKIAYEKLFTAEPFREAATANEKLLYAFANILDDYTKGDAWYSGFFRLMHGHANRHHTKEIAAIVHRIGVDITDPKILLEIIEAEIPSGNLGGSLKRRMAFMWDKLNNPTPELAPVINTLISI